MEGTYRTADKNIETSSLYGTVHGISSDYRNAGMPDLIVKITPEDIETEREQTPAYADDYLDILAVYRKIAEAMPEWGTVLMHGSAIAVDDEAYLFAAPSGTGKSTHAGLWRRFWGDHTVMANDDKPLFYLSEESIIVFGTPWNVEHHLGENISAPLRAVCLFERGTENTII